MTDRSPGRVLGLLLLCAAACGRTELLLDDGPASGPGGDGGATARADAGRTDANDAGASGACPVDADGGAPPCEPGSVLSGGTCVPAPRPIAPLSASLSTTQRPLLRWQLAKGTDGVLVDVCRDRACGSVVTSFASGGTSAQPPVALTAGVYFWRLRGTAGGLVVTPPGAVWELRVGARDAPVATSWGDFLDVNGDGYADVVVGAWGAGSYVGRAYVYLGAPGGLANEPAISLSGPDGPGYFGWSVAGAGDVNGDGYGDVVVGAWGADHLRDVGAAYVYLGGPCGLAAAPYFLGGPDGVGADFGLSVAAAGDVNGDGYGDILVGAWDDGPTGARGRAYLFPGSAAGPQPTLAQALAGPSGSPGASFGVAVASAGDVNGDGFSDFLVGADGDAQTPPSTYVYLGGSTGTPTPVATLTSPQAPGGIAASLASAGDGDGDGYADVVLGALATASSPGHALVFRGGPAGPSTSPDVTLVAPDGTSGSFGMAVAGAGDVNGDGFADLVVGQGDGAYVYLGGANGLSSTPSAVLRSVEAESGEFGAAVAGGGDVNRDGFADVVVGAQAWSGAQGGAFAFLGGPAGTSTQPATVLLGRDGATAEFGGSVACGW